MEDVIIGNLIHNEEYTRKVIPFIQEDYFSEQSSKIVYKLIASHIGKYNKQPTKEVIHVELENMELIEPVYNASVALISKLEPDNKSDLKWLIDSTEKWAQDRALYNAIMRAVKVYDGSDKDMGRGTLPQLMSDALGVSFETSIGHDYIDDWEKRYEFYTENKRRLPFNIEILNKITDGGLFGKTLTVMVAPTGVGKSLVLCDLAASYYSNGKNVLYITLEMSEEETSQRIDANLMGIDIGMVSKMPKDVFEKKINKIREKTAGKLIIEEFPTAAGNVNHFRHLLNELALKKKFRPDVIFIDYINICSSARLKNGGNHNSYTIVKSIAEEIRGLAIEYDVPILTATQTNRSGATDSDYEIDQIAESFGIAHTADLVLGIIRTEELDNLDQVLFKQLKNRYNDLNYYRRFVVGIDRAKMRLFDTDNSAQDKVSNETSPDNPVFDKGKFSEDGKNDRKKKLKNLSV